MPVKKKYTLFYCSECGEETLTANKPYKRNYFCAHCGDDMELERVDNLWIEKLFYHKKRWTKDEDQALIYGVKKGLSWKEIADGLPFRSPQAVRRRWQYMQEKGLISK